MKHRMIVLIVILVVILSATVGCQSKQEENQQQTEQANINAVTSVVETFGHKLQTVSLMAPKDSVSASMKESYGPLVSPALLAKWQNDPENAPGRWVSSPWPDRIEITTTAKLAEGSYEVQGMIIEVTSVEKENGGAAAKRAITLTVNKTGDQWLIDDVTLGTYQESETTDAITYHNTKFGFAFTLPLNWKAYTIISGQWEGRAVSGSHSGEVVETGEIVTIRHPQWTAEKPRQDIPIMIFTHDQWDAVKAEELSVGAAPIPPSELGRNAEYVFALPERYNFAFPEGFEEVADIIASNPLQAGE